MLSATKIKMKAWKTDVPSPMTAAVTRVVPIAMRRRVRAVVAVSGVVTAAMAWRGGPVATVSRAVAAAMAWRVVRVAVAGVVTAAVALTGVMVAVTRLTGGRCEDSKAGRDGDEGEQFFHDRIEWGSGFVAAAKSAA